MKICLSLFHINKKKLLKNTIVILAYSGLYNKFQIHIFVPPPFLIHIFPPNEIYYEGVCAAGEKFSAFFLQYFCKGRSLEMKKKYFHKY